MVDRQILLTLLNNFRLSITKHFYYVNRWHLINKKSWVIYLPVQHRPTSTSILITAHHDTKIIHCINFHRKQSDLLVPLSCVFNVLTNQHIDLLCAVTKHYAVFTKSVTNLHQVVERRDEWLSAQNSIITSQFYTHLIIWASNKHNNL